MERLRKIQGLSNWSGYYYQLLHQENSRRLKEAYKAEAKAWASGKRGGVHSDGILEILPPMTKRTDQYRKSYRRCAEDSKNILRSPKKLQEFIQYVTGENVTLSRCHHGLPMLAVEDFLEGFRLKYEWWEEFFATPLDELLLHDIPGAGTIHRAYKYRFSM